MYSLTIGFYKFTEIGKSPNPKHFKQNDIDVVILVFSRLNNYKKRKAIRSHFDNFPQTKKEGAFRVKTFFVSSLDKATTSLYDYLRIRNEIRQSQDLILTNVEDNLKNEALKLLSSFYWVSLLLQNDSEEATSKKKWIVKVEDDVCLNMTSLDNLVASLNKSTKEPEKEAIYCHISNLTVPSRDPMERYYLSKMEWMPEKFPKSCSSSFWTMSVETSQVLLAKFQESLRSNYLWIGDLYVTGVLRQMANLSLVDLRELGRQIGNSSFTDQKCFSKIK